uniref:PiggyBac transposable element-derived protein domain-containing protein n=1 Tax=Knipowitschia caucasica TaxID=637954 RepID=A0AAV2MH94_KNICA
MSDCETNTQTGRLSLKTVEQVFSETIFGDNSEVEDLSDVDDDMLDTDYEPPQRERSCSEDSRGDEDPILQPIELNRGPVQKLPTDKMMKKAGRGTSAEVTTEDGKMSVVNWYDNKTVLMSTVHGTQPEDTCKRWDKKQKRYVTISRPSVIREYNSKMGGVDLVDRMMSYYRMSVRAKKWTLRMLMHFTDLALANSWLQYRKDLTACSTPKKSIIQFLEFRTEVAQTFLAQQYLREDNTNFSKLAKDPELPEPRTNHPVRAVPHISQWWTDDVVWQRLGGCVGERS